MAEIRADPLAFLTTMAERYGAVAAYRTDRDDVVTVNAPDLAGEVLMAGEARYTKQGTPDDAMLTPLLGEGLLTSHGDEWQRQRAMTTPMFGRRRVERFGPAMVAQASALADRWLAEPAGRALPVDHDLTGLTLAVVADAVLGGDLSGIGRGFGAAVDAVNRFMSHGDPMDTPDTGVVLADEASFPRARRTLDGVVWALVQARLAIGDDAEGPPDLLGALLGARDPLTGAPLERRQIRDQVMTMVMAGHETTAKALTWSLYLLDRHPAALERAQAEVAALLGDRPPAVEDLAGLRWCRAVLSEAMRLYPPIWVISRRAVTDGDIGGFAVRAGTLVCVSPWVLHHDPTCWDAPDVFEPGRFLGDGEPRRSPFAYLPFGAGPRQCIGRGFALLEAQLVLARLLQLVRLRLVPGHPVTPQALVTLRPAQGMAMTAEPASEPAGTRGPLS